MNRQQKLKYFSKLNYKKSDIELSRSTGYSVQTIGRWRIRLGKPPCVHGLVKRSHNLLLEARKWPWEKGVNYLAKMSGKSRMTIYTVAKRLGVPRGMIGTPGWRNR